MLSTATENELLGLRTGLQTYVEKPRDENNKDRPAREERAPKERAPREKKVSGDQTHEHKEEDTKPERYQKGEKPAKF